MLEGRGDDVSLTTTGPQAPDEPVVDEPVLNEPVVDEPVMNKRAAKHVIPRLAPSETVHHLVNGKESRHNGALVLTNQRLLFVRFHGSGPPVFDFHLTSISSIAVEGSSAKVQIVIHSLGVVAQVDAVRRAEAEAFVEQTRSALPAARSSAFPAKTSWARAERRAPEPPAPVPDQDEAPAHEVAAETPAPSASGPSEVLVTSLRELAELHRAGVLDDYEFALAKAKLLT